MKQSQQPDKNWSGNQGQQKQQQQKQKQPFGAGNKPGNGQPFGGNKGQQGGINQGGQGGQGGQQR